MEAVKQGQIRVHLLNGTSYDCPELNKKNVVRCVGKAVARIEHYKPIAVATATATPAPTAKPEGKTKASLLGELLKDNKVDATELIKWVEKSKDVGDISIATKGDTRKTVKAAAKKRINELL